VDTCGNAGNTFTGNTRNQYRRLKGDDLMYGWLIYFLVVLVASLAVGKHLGRFRESCTEMTGMMAGMTIGMLGGFALGYGMTAAAGRDLFIGNLTGVLLGAALGGWFGRTGGLMGIMDGSMGGVMGGAMGAMIAAMVFPDWALNWTGVLFGGIYVVGSGALVALIESRAPEHEAIHWLLPKLALVRREPRRAQARGRAMGAARPAVAAAAPANSTRTATARVATTSVAPTSPAAAPPMQDYYALFGVPKNAGLERIEEAYLDLLAGSEVDTIKRAERALATLSNPERRTMYDAALAESLKRQPKASAADGRGDCCPPPKKKATASSTSTAAATPLAPQVAATATTSTALATPTPSAVPTKSREQTHTALSASQDTARETSQRGTARPTKTGGHRGSQGSPGTQGGKQRQAQQAGAGAGKHSDQRTSAQAYRDDGYGSYGSYGSYGYSRKDGRTNRYQDGGPSFGRHFAIGMTATVAAAVVLLLVVYISIHNSGSSAQASGYLSQSPPGAAYHVPNAVPSEAQLESKAVAATVGADGVQTADLVLDQATSSYKPAAIRVKKGSPVRLNVTVNGSSRDCRSVVRLPALGAQALTQPGQVVPMSFTPSQAGVYEFNCPMQMMNPSYLVVTD
jgi:curved DNA-binding protein CbpA/plastocyanin